MDRQVIGRKRGLGRLALVGLAATLMLVPTDAKASRNVGTGIVHGTAQFLGEGLPPANQPCEPDDFELRDAFAIGVMMNTVVTGFAGELALTGGGRAACGTATASGGTLTVTVSGTGPTGSQLDCETLSGTFDRTAVVVRVTLAGSCVVNQFTRGTTAVQFLSQLAFTPLPPGAGVTGPVMTSNFDGTFVVFPANS